jgi:hypothetical protein
MQVFSNYGGKPTPQIIEAIQNLAINDFNLSLTVNDYGLLSLNLLLN